MIHPGSFKTNSELGRYYYRLFLCILIGWAFYLIIGRQIIALAYYDTTLGFLNWIVPGELKRPLSYYLERADKVMSVLTILSLSVPLILRALGRNKWWMLVVFSLIFILRLPSSVADIPRSLNEAVYLYVGQDMAGGGVLYKTAFDHKGPVLFFLAYMVVKIFGNSIFIARLFTSFSILLSMFFLYLISRRLFSEKISLIPPLMYGLFFTRPEFECLSMEAEIFMMLFLLIAALCFISYMQKGRYPLLMLYLCGLFSAVALFIKPNVLFPMSALGGMLWMKRREEIKQNPLLYLHDLLYLLTGVMTIITFILVYFMVHNAIEDFYQAFILYNINYVEQVGLIEGIRRLFLFFATAIKVDIVTDFSVASLLFLAFKRNYTKEQKELVFFILLLLALSLLGILWLRNMSTYYYLIMGFSYSLLIALAISLINIDARDINRCISLLIIMCLLLSPIINNLCDFINNYQKQNAQPFYVIADYIHRRTPKDDTLFVLGTSPLLNVLAQRKAPTKYFLWLWFFGKWERALVKTDTLAWSTILNSKPGYIIYRPRNIEKVRRLERFMFTNYRFEKMFWDWAVFKRK